MDTISVDEIPLRRRSLDFDILKIRIDLGLERLQERVNEAYRAYDPVRKDGYDFYAGLGLQYSDPSADPIYDAVEQSSYVAESGEETVYRRETPYDFVHLNELGRKFDFVFDAFSNVRLYRGRILKALPGHVHAVHIDGLKDCRIHVPVFTHRFCLMFFGDRPYHMPADGSAYLCNTSRYHQFGNFSPDPRTHLVFVL